jgi:UPF0755 protein
MRPTWKIAIICLLVFTIAGGVIFSLPSLYIVGIKNIESQSATATVEQFPVTVDPKNKVIAENANVDMYLESSHSPLQASVIVGAGNIFWKLFEIVATAIDNAPWYQSLAGTNGRFVAITAGMRKEQVASAFGSALNWSSTDKKAFLTPAGTSTFPLPEGSFAPNVYFVGSGTTGAEAQALVNEKFQGDVLEHYGSTTASIVPLHDALTIASMVERETTRPEDMRLIAGIIWNRIFINMRLQIDATLQYAKANTYQIGSWWPRVVSSDKYIKSPFNTYLHPGLPPNPIANPSVAAIVAALNPLKTSCLYYFNDKSGTFHCSDTYAQHVALIKKFYGQ